MVSVQMVHLWEGRDRIEMYAVQLALSKDVAVASAALSCPNGSGNYTSAHYYITITIIILRV